MSLNNFNPEEIHEDQLRILKIIAEKKCTYASEISSEIGIKSTKVGTILHELHDADLVERIYPGNYASLDDSRLTDRRQDFWADGKRGNNKENSGFRNPNFYGLNSDLAWVLKVKDKPFYVDEYHNQVNEKPEKSTIDLLKQRVTGDERYYG